MSKLLLEQTRKLYKKAENISLGTAIAKAHTETGVKYLFEAPPCEVNNRNHDARVDRWLVLYDQYKYGVDRFREFGPMDTSELRILHRELYDKAVA